MTASPAGPPAPPDSATPLEPSPTPLNRQLEADRRNARRRPSPICRRHCKRICCRCMGSMPGASRR